MPHWIEKIKSSIGEITGLVSLLVGYGMAIRGMSPTPWPQTTAVLVVIVSTAFLCRQWWFRITRQSGLLLLKPESNQLPWLGQLIDPFRSRGHRSYSLPLTRRRIEGVLLSGLILGTLTFPATKIQAIQTEINPAASDVTFKDCQGDGSPGALLIVVAEFYEIDTPLNFEVRLYEQLASRVKWLGRIRVCRSEKVIKDQPEAIEFGGKEKAAIVIWGRSDPALYEVNIEIPKWDLPDYEWRSFPTPEAQTSTFQASEPLRTSFFVEYILSQILYLRGDTSGARELLAVALASEQIEKLRNNPENKEDISEAYFLLGYYHDSPASPEPDLDLAIEYYSQALEINENLYSARLNRGKAYQRNKQYDMAVQDFKTAASLIQDSNPRLASAALMNAFAVYADTDPSLAEDSFTQAVALDPLIAYRQRGANRMFTQPRLAIEDLSSALALDTSDPFIYHFLGQAQLMNGQPEDATRTYQQAISAAHWKKGDRDSMIVDLNDLGKNHPSLGKVVPTIIELLRAAGVP
jgi:tetratricopeptide (TPR) repeat protein